MNIYALDRQDAGRHGRPAGWDSGKALLRCGNQGKEGQPDLSPFCGRDQGNWDGKFLPNRYTQPQIACA